ncbi:hypothetical protein H8356DRAFT_1309294 [Neocallimastix lanati (nom. inval.)]|nr:hypothetical protein H8356DRAFT_1309294 [Neocallimastix sp. JGI-2020a]
MYYYINHHVMLKSVHRSKSGRSHSHNSYRSCSGSHSRSRSNSLHSRHFHSSYHSHSRYRSRSHSPQSRSRSLFQDLSLQNQEVLIDLDLIIQDLVQNHVPGISYEELIKLLLTN